MLALALNVSIACESRCLPSCEVATRGACTEVLQLKSLPQSRACNREMGG